MNCDEECQKLCCRGAMAMGHEALSSASMHDATEIERQSEVGTKKGGSIEWRVCPSRARCEDPARRIRAGLVAVRLTRRSACGCGTR
jgi:hypothetical protein